MKILQREVALGLACAPIKDAPPASEITAVGSLQIEMFR
jgi:hypothetical protein